LTHFVIVRGKDLKNFNFLLNLKGRYEVTGSAAWHPQKSSKPRHKYLLCDGSTVLDRFANQLTDAI